MSQSSTIGCLLAAALIATAAPAATQSRELMLCDFETNEGGLNLGGEFPGAEGQFAVAAAAAHDGHQGGRLSFDLTKGAYVAWGLELPTPLVAGAQSLSLWGPHRCRRTARALQNPRRDRAGPHAQLGRAAGGPVAALSFAVVRRWTPTGSGANDGKIHWPINYVQIGVEPGPNRIGAVELDTLTVTTTATPRDNRAY